MWVGIVGAGAEKFTASGRIAAKRLIVDLLRRPGVEGVVSGRSPLGGVDAWAEEAARLLGLSARIFPPRTQRWSDGYRVRNLEIVKTVDEVHSIVVDRYPPGFEGQKFDLCYHCQTVTHVKSGGCWTMREAQRLGKFGELHIVENR